MMIHAHGIIISYIKTIIKSCSVEKYDSTEEKRERERESGLTVPVDLARVRTLLQRKGILGI